MNLTIASALKKDKQVFKKRLFLSPPHMGGQELDYIKAAFESNYIAPVGPQVNSFERAFSEYTGIKHCVALSSGTAALHLAMRMLDIGPGDEVFASTLTFMGSVSPIVFEGARPVFIDADVRTWNMDPDLLETELARCARQDRLPKAVVPTDLYGQSADLERILKICRAYRIPVVADSAEALGARYRSESNRRWTIVDSKAQIATGDGDWVHAGNGAWATAFSFNGNKIITTSGGGMLASDDSALIEKAIYLSQQARQPLAHYEHTDIGYNYRMSNIVAALGLGQLEVLEERVKRKREIFDYYRNALGDLPGIEFMPEAEYGRCTRWLTVILITPSEFGTDRETVRLSMEAENIESRPVWKPMHLQPVFNINNGRALNGGKKTYPARVVGGAVSEDLFDRGLCLPSGTAMSRADLDRVVRVIRGMHRR